MSPPPDSADLPVALTLVIPLYRSAATVRQLVQSLETLEVPGGIEIVLVHDGSPDETLRVCRELLPSARVPITLIDLSRNFGEHNAVLAGLRVARGEYVVTMDDDLQNPPSEVLKLVERARADQLDCVFGEYVSKKHSLFRNLGSRFTNWMGRVVLDKPGDLYLSSFRCLSAFLTHEIARYDGPFPYIDGLILQSTSRIGSVQVEHAPRASGESGYTLRKLLRLWMSMFVNFSIMPLRAATVLGFGLGIFGLLQLIMVFVEYYVNGTPARGWGSLMGTILIFSGAQLVMLGLFGEYLGRVFLTLNRRPQSIVRSVERSGGNTPR